MFCSHGWASKSKTPNPVVKSRSQNITMIEAVNAFIIMHCEAICSSVNGEIFEQFMNEANVLSVMKKSLLLFKIMLISIIRRTIQKELTTKYISCHLTPLF
ncbi:hypothetical protein RF11_05217 [Thelohanellus kitauei]|uniref:Uncharacterized protein n=1 Tax=Thelohanellus kitauei TaxID=669202 RepID=A0A0C2M6C9_THEKT|nr:hypothetical protein RF11_05217 [Thelohanellus kitauei]